MEYKALGRTGLMVSEFGLGTMTFGEHTKFKGIGGLDRAAAQELIRYAVEQGVNFIDTANSYSDGESERILGESVKNLGIQRESLVIATKVRMRVGEGPNNQGLTRKHILHQVEQSLKRLQTDYIDLYQIHAFDPQVPIEETLKVLDELVKSGKVRYIGAGNLPAWVLSRALCISEFKNLERFASLQAYYTVMNRELEREIIPLIKDQHVGLLVWSPLAGGLLSGKYTRDFAQGEGRRKTVDFPPVNINKAFDTIDILRPVAEKYNVSVAQVSLAWLRQQKAVTSIIVGAKKVGQLKDNLQSSELILSPEDVAEINRVTEPVPEYPGWILDYSKNG